MLASKRSRIVPMNVLRWRARAPRIAFTTVCAVLSVAGLRVVLAGPSAPPTSARRAAAATTSDVDGFAEGFARAFLTSTQRGVAERERALKLYGYVDDGAAAEVGATRVAWTTVVASRPRPGSGRVVTVLADDGRRRWFLAVTVSVDGAGRRYVATRPALVGPPAVKPDAVAPAELEVDDPELRQVSARVVRHFLAGHRADLSADLVRGAGVTVPPVALRLADVESTTWVSRPSRVAVAVTAEGPGRLRLPLRYELQVLRVGGRWLVRSVHVNPLDRGEPR